MLSNLRIRSLRRSNGALLVIALSALGLVSGAILAPQEANAGASGYDYWGAHTYKGVSVPSGQLLGVVRGKGTRIDEAGGEFMSGGNVCNWSISIVFYQGRDHLARVVNQPRQHNCTHEGGYKLDFDGWQAPEGRVCIRLYHDLEASAWPAYATRYIGSPKSARGGWSRVSCHPPRLR